MVFSATLRNRTPGDVASYGNDKAVEIPAVHPQGASKSGERAFMMSKISISMTYHKHAAICTQNFLDHLLCHALYFQHRQQEFIIDFESTGLSHNSKSAIHSRVQITLQDMRLGSSSYGVLGQAESAPKGPTKLV